MRVCRSPLPWWPRGLDDRGGRRSHPRTRRDRRGRRAHRHQPSRHPAADGDVPDPRTWQLEIPGLEYAGVVAAVGADVSDWSVGDRAMGIEAGGCYAGQVVTHARQALPVPDAIASADAAAIPEVFLTAWDALVVQGGLTSGRWALVHAGASGVGTAAIQVAKAIGARIAVTCSAGKMDACRDLGADVVLERRPPDWLGALVGRRARRRRRRARRDRRRGDRSQPASGPHGRHDRAGRPDGWRQRAGQCRADPVEADHVDRHHPASPSDRAQARARANASSTKCSRCSTAVHCGR